MPIGVGLVLSAWLPVELTLPVLSAVLVLSAAGVAVVASASGRPSQDGLTYWDVSGFLVFLGIAAGLLADPEDVLPLLQREALGLAPPPRGER